VLRSLFGIPILCVALAVELALTLTLITDIGYQISDSHWLIAHGAASLLAAICTASILHKLVPGKRIPLVLFLLSLNFFLPLAGTLGTVFAVAFGSVLSNGRHKDNIFWQFTSNADLPFAAPINRPLPKLDSRGFVEQLAFDTETDKLYNKVAASKHIRDSCRLWQIQYALADCTQLLGTAHSRRRRAGC